MDWSALRRCRAGLVSVVVVFVMVAAGCGENNVPPPEPELRACQQTCEAAPDCGNPDNWMCVEGFCRLSAMAAGQCQTDRECWAKLSGWRTRNCRNRGCVRGDVCILVGNTTYCAPQAPVQETCPVGTPYDAELADGSGRVDVCANQQARCEEGTCRDPCTSDADCGGERTCDTDTGECLCTANSDCADELVCNQPSGECVCRNDADCTREGYGTCYDGTCGCGDDETCSGLGDNYTCAPVTEE